MGSSCFSFDFTIDQLSLVIFSHFTRYPFTGFTAAIYTIINMSNSLDIACTQDISNPPIKLATLAELR